MTDPPQWGPSDLELKPKSMAISLPVRAFILNPVVKELFSLAGAEAAWVHLGAPKKAVGWNPLILFPSSSHPKSVEFPHPLGNQTPKQLVTKRTCFYHQDWLVLGYFHLSEKEIKRSFGEKDRLISLP